MQGVYVIFNKITVDFIIGSAKNIIKRRTSHLQALEENRHWNILLQRAYNKYGCDSFEFALLEEVLHKENLIEREQYWIDYYETHADYNILPEAGSWLGMHHSESTKRKISITSSKTMRRKWKEPEYRKRHIEGLIGHKLSNKTKKKISESHKGKPLSEKHKKKLKKIFKGRKVPWLKGKKLSEEHKKKIGEAAKQILSDPEIRKKISESTKRRWRRWRLLNQTT